MDSGVTPASGSNEDRGRPTLDPMDGFKAMGLSTSRPSTPVRKKSSTKRED